VYVPAAREFASTFDRLGHDQTLEALERLTSGIATDFDDVLSGISFRLEQVRSALDPADPRLDELLFLRKLTEQAMTLTHKLLDCAQTAHAVTSRQAAPGPSKPTILLTEDESAVRKLARRILERAGYRVVEAVNAEEALEIAAVQAEPFALLLTDMMLPGVNGTELAAALQIKQPDLPVVCMSGYTRDTMPDTGTSSVSFHFLEKPFTPASLLAAVSAVVSFPAAHATNAA
jgi:CheY-like chemotaxis protein